MVPQILLDREACPGPVSIEINDGKPSASTSSQDHVAAQMPVQKATRQWAAWTRQEEELFFAALRQVGKNFEKITSRVQSKNKDQVRHYYYRLVRRMNKLLGPELSLDARNSKDTIAAMLRWWSLLEKYSCKASKLHLKPRRFKTFIETLGNQLLKDRKKNIRKRPTGEENSSMTPVPVQTQGKSSAHENRALKIVLVDGQNIQKIGSGKGTLIKRNVNIGMNRSNCKRDSTSTKTEKKRQKTGLVATSAYKRWEKAAIAGVSLVADAAEHLERVDTDKETEHLERVDTDKGIDHLERVDTDNEIGHLERMETDKDLKHVQETPGNDGSQHAGTMVHSTPEPPQCILNENNSQNSKKLKLQLFPIDECTRKALEMDNHNPHLELTLSTRKKISSIVEHLNRKWGKLSLLSQELMLFPYWAQKENLVGYQKWTKDSPLCAADIHYLLGNPAVFRLRYGWFSKAEVELATAQALSCANQNEQCLNINMGKEHNEAKTPSGPLNDMSICNEQITAPTSSTTSVTVTMPECGGSDSCRVAEAVEAMRQVYNTKDRALSSGDWADSLTSISMGDLLSDSMQNMDVNCTEFPMPDNSNFQHTPFSCDSFDAAIAAHIYKHDNKVELQQGLPSHGPSIWDAEETCDAFAFQKNATLRDGVQNPFRDCSPEASHNEIEESTDMEKITDTDPTCGDLVDEFRPVHTSDNSTKDFGGLTDIYWPDSLGPLDLEIPPRRYHNDDLILSDNFGGLSRLIANSMDSFQSCSFLGLDKKEATGSTGESRPCSSFSDFKISSEV